MLPRPSRGGEGRGGDGGREIGGHSHLAPRNFGRFITCGRRGVRVREVRTRTFLSASESLSIIVSVTSAILGDALFVQIVRNWRGYR